MSASDLTQPFDYNPPVTAINETSYTVPAGKYAYVEVQIWAKALVSNADIILTASPVVDAFNTKSDYQQSVKGLWLKATDAITTTGSNATGIASLADGIPRLGSANAETQISALLNGTAFLEVIAIAHASISMSSGLLTAITYANFSGDRGIQISVAEFTALT